MSLGVTVPPPVSAPLRRILPIEDRGGYTSAPMSVVACSGFPVPVSRYWREFQGVEISETELGIPGAGTVRRWLREAPEEFVFTLLAPKDIVGAGFELNETTEKLVKEVGNLCKTMKAQAVVFAAPPEFTAARANKSAVKKFVEALPARYPKAVLSLPAWKQVKSGRSRQAKGPHKRTPALIAASWTMLIARS